MNRPKHHEELKEAIDSSVDLLGTLISRVIHDSVGASEERKQVIFNACMVTLNDVLEERILNQPKTNQKTMN